MQEESKNNPNIKAYIEKVIAASGDFFLNEEENKTAPAPKEIITLQEFLSTIEKSSSKERGYCFRFGRNATADDIKQLFEIMLIEKDHKKLLHYLFVFSKTEMPDVSETIMALTESDDKELRNAAINALANIKNNVVRELALKLLDNGRLDALALFIHNYCEGDFKLIFSKLPEHDDPDDIHWYTGHILGLCDKNICSEATECLLWIYENTPCSICREESVSNLIEIEKFPKALEEEFKYDCHEYDTKSVIN